LLLLFRAAHPTIEALNECGVAAPSLVAATCRKWGESTKGKTW